MRLYLFFNLQSESAREAAQRAAELLRREHELFSSEPAANCLKSPVCQPGQPEDQDLIVSIGGDGTVLRAARLALKANRPLLGVNAGHLGYLCALRLEELALPGTSSLTHLRQRPHANLEFAWKGQAHTALNELIFAKGDFGTTVDVRARLSDRELEPWLGDGLIICTPTGSSAYNHSAGGPLLLPDTACFALTPLCPTGGNRASLVLPDSETITVTTTARNTSRPPQLYADGICMGDITAPITVRRAEKPLMMMERNG